MADRDGATATPMWTLMNRAEAAAALGVPPGTMRRLTETGEVRARKIGRRVFVSPEALEEYRKRAEADTYAAELAASRKRRGQAS